jgi:hypothetical protein
MLEQLTQYLKPFVFWNITSCSPLKVNRHFRGIWRLHLQDRKKPSKKPAWSREQADVELLHGLFFDPEYGGHKFLRNVSWRPVVYVALYVTRLFITTAARTSNPTSYLFLLNFFLFFVLKFIFISSQWVYFLSPFFFISFSLFVSSISFLVSYNPAFTCKDPTRPKWSTANSSM